MATGMFSGVPSPNRSVLGAQQLQRPAEPYLRQQYPELYGALGGFMGMAPDEMSGSVLDPNTARVRAGAEYGFPVGTAAQVIPAVGLLSPVVKAGVRALGPTAVGMGERYLQRQGLMPGVVPKNPNAPENIGKLAKIKNSPMVKLYHSSPYEDIDEVGFNAETQLERGDKRGIFFSTYPQENYGEFVYEVLVPRKAITWDTLGGKKEKLTDAIVKPEYANLIQFSRKEHGVENYLIDNAPSPYPQQAALDLAQQRAAIAAAMGVAAPNLMAAPIGGIGLGAGTQDNEMPDAVRQYMADPRYSDPFADTTR